MTTNIDQITLSLLANIPVVWWGTPGMGKTAISQELTSDLSARLGLSFRFVSISAAYLDPADIAGIPFPSQEAGRIMRRHDDWARTICLEPSVLLIDEINRGSRPVLNALLRLLQERLVGDVPLHPETRIICTANPPSSDRTAADLGAAAANRLVHVHGAPPVDRWLAWLEPRSRGAGLVAAFLRARPHMIDAVPKAQELQGAWASRRSWTNAATLLTLGFQSGTLDTALEAISGTVGTGPGLELASFVLSQDLPDPRDIMAAPDTFTIPGRMDILFAATSGLVGLAHQEFSADAYRRVETWLLRLSDAGARDVGANYLTALLAGPRDAQGAASGKQPAGFCISPRAAQVYMPVLKAAGVIK